MDDVTVVSALFGGALIGLSAVLLMWSNGRIAGISGMVSGLLVTDASGRLWRALFLVGLVAAPVVYRILYEPVQISFPHNTGMMALGGLLVGFGTRLGGGCTSGHGVCGMARFSKRSLVATLTFMATAFVTVYIIQIAGASQ